MELLERYLRQIRKHLPFRDKEDTINELRSLILEEFDSRSNGTNEEELIYEIIKENGYPVEVAARYRGSDPLISNVLRPFFYYVLKIVTMVVPFGIMVGTIIGYYDDEYDLSYLGLLLEMAYAIPSIINALLMSYGIVFIVFVLIEKYGKDEFEKEILEFNPKNLPAIPKDIFRISIASHIIGLLATVLFLYLLNSTQGLVTITLDNIKYPLLNENFDNLLPFINSSIIIAIIVVIIELSKQKRSLFTITLDFIQAMYSGVILVLLASNDIFTQIIIDEYDISILPNMTRIMMYVGATAGIIIGTIKFIKIIIKYKNDR